MGWPRAAATLLVAAGLGLVGSRELRAQVPDLPLVPMPYKITQPESGIHVVKMPLEIAFVGPVDVTLSAAVERFARRWESRTGEKLGPTVNDLAAAQFIISCRTPGNAAPELSDDESYELRVSARQIQLSAPTRSGIYHGLSTLLQLVQVDGTWVRLPCCVITDRPRCAWRGLTIDVVHHWLPLPALERTLDAMELVKFNVLQLHLGDRNGLRLAIPNLPDLTAGEAPDEIYTPEQLRHVVAYAAARGIRVVPELALSERIGPLHANAADVALSWSGTDVVPQPPPPNDELDPTDARTYQRIEALLGHISAVFQDQYLSIGDTSAVSETWQAEPRFAAFIREHSLEGSDGLYRYFLERVAGLLAVHHRLPVEVARASVANTPKLSRRRTPGVRIIAVELDGDRSALDLYAVDPLGGDVGLTPASGLVGYGEAELRTEWVTATTIDTQLWPRAAGIAERLWTDPSPRWSRSLDRRLAATALRLHEMGVGWNRSFRFEMAEIDPDSPEAAALRVVASAVEPVKDAERRQLQSDGKTPVPLTQLADWARPESVAARQFREHVEAWVASGNTDLAPEREPILNQLRLWSAAAAIVATIPADADPMFQDRVRVVDLLRQLGDIGVEACGAVNHRRLERARADACYAIIRSAASPTHAAVRLPFLHALSLLVAAGSEDQAAHSASPGQWRAFLERVVVAQGL